MVATSGFGSRVLPFFFALLVTPLAFATSVDRECGETPWGEAAYRWCIYKTDRTRNPDILLYLHGGGGSELEWEAEGFSAKAEQSWGTGGSVPPTVVTFSFGEHWLIGEQGIFGNLHHEILNLIVPVLEAKVGGLGVGRRFLLGTSMGGFNASQLLLKNPEQFSKVALLCPAMASLDPFADDQTLEDWAKKNKARPELVKYVAGWVKFVYEIPEVWLRHDPLRLLSQMKANPNLPRVFLSTGSEDEMGFFEGATQFQSVAPSVFQTFVWRPVSGGHCSFDFDGMLKFFY